ncbi:Fe-S cluster assembly protein IscX [Pontibacterium sp.]|jgi:FeS assembly protein IscX|uniref:Fe-S cluster assembly protein IscX n=1 Tax=Pontibacterium sp. TaxID=2036026 RepID=UPI0035620798
MSLKWVDVIDIAIELCEQYPDQDPLTISFPDLYEKVMGLEEFDDDPNRCGEKILEAIQAAWIEEQD